jgi:regulatory protein
MRAEAFERALGALAHRERTEGEMIAWLGERGYSDAEIADAVERLIAGGALDDADFARRFAEDKRELAGWGPDRIREALAHRRIDRNLIDAAVEAEGAEGQLERAVALLARRGRPAEDEASRASALSYLARRGYDAELAYDAVRRFERAA